jgi:hypothetical protein
LSAAGRKGCALRDSRGLIDPGNVNTRQRNIVRVGCFVLAALAILAGLSSGDIPGVLAGISGAVALVVVGKVVWAGRPMGHVVGLGPDIREAERPAARVAELERRPAARALREPSHPGPMKARPVAPRSPDTDGPDVVQPITCVDCGTKNRGDAYNCTKCGALMRSRRGAGSPK